MENTVSQHHTIRRGKFSTNLSPVGRIRQVLNTTSCHNFGTTNWALGGDAPTLPRAIRVGPNQGGREIGGVIPDLDKPPVLTQHFFCPLVWTYPDGAQRRGQFNWN